MLSLFIWASRHFFDSEVSSSPFGLGRECMSVTFHSTREKVYNKICSFVALYPDFCISAENLKLSITEMPIDSDFPRQRYFFLTYNATGTLRKETKPEHLPPL